MSIRPPYLKKGDLVAITCPAKKLPRPMQDAVHLLESWGLRVVLGETTSAEWHQFAGDDQLRAKDMQRFIDDPEVKAIFAARGGYGTIRMIDLVDFSPLAENPKWLIGFSDITIIHAHLLANYGLQSIHGQMPINIPDATISSIQTLKDALFGAPLIYHLKGDKQNKTGKATGQLIGGNLTLLTAILGSASDMDYTGKILFIEDVGEYLYATDRMIHTLKRAGKLKDLAGIIVGGFTEVKDNDIPFGFSANEIILEAVKEYNYPVILNFPAGHVADNNSLILGAEVSIETNTDKASISFINN
ncbi:LD-carboxypeptidase [Mucilaginibacter sp. RS28]|uniref:LD-carboxypeptidase n=1 Tax=Mucilaginibacter straminoryzae TaxID=2932774 RepID=A0A9X2BB27_9SPHI|nr:LD-carboxypeptidase [Mucilaginibacter straminoryzae]MCJ8211996.1 LD-carboxypeptidase [Mucilaginibacter straminoryzae]